jgi:hypothetical protein
LGADFAAGLAAGFADLAAEFFCVEAEMTGVSFALVFFVEAVLSLEERKKPESKPLRFLPSVPISFFAT